MVGYGIALKCSAEEAKLFEEMRDLGRKKKALRDKECEELVAALFRSNPWATEQAPVLTSPPVEKNDGLCQSNDSRKRC